MGSGAKIRELLTDRYSVSADLITPDAKLADLGFNSLTMVELVCDIEETFDVEVALSGVAIETFGDAVALVDALVAKKEG